MEISRLYFDQLGSEKEKIELAEVEEQEIKVEVYQCKDCLTVYDPNYGDQNQNIAPTPFENLAKEYICSLCDAQKENFEKKILVKKVV